MKRRSIVVFVALLAGVVSLKRHHRAAAATPPDLAAEYTARCGAASTNPDCDVLRAATVLDTANALDELRLTRDPHAVDIALDAITVDEPPVQEAAAKILAPVASKRDDAARAFVPLLTGSHPALQKLAVDVLRRYKDRDLAAISNQWTQNHPHPDTRSAWLRDARVPVYVPKFPAYPGAEPYGPASSEHAVAWSTPDSVDRVIAAYAKDTKASLDAAGWAQHFATTTITVGPSQMQQLIEQYRQHPDPKLLEQIKQASKNPQARQGFSGSMPQTSVFQAQPRPGTESSFHGLIIDGDADHATRAIAVYREEAIHATIIVMVWDLVRYHP